jgi:hypothetical protein
MSSDRNNKKWLIDIGCLLILLEMFFSDQTRRKPFEKEFKVRDAPLTERFENSNDIKTIYNLFAIILISLLTNTIISDYSKTGQWVGVRF